MNQQPSDIRGATPLSEPRPTDATASGETGAPRPIASAPGASADAPGRDASPALPPVRPLPYWLSLIGMCLYCVWLLLPTVQVLGRAATGVAAVALFALGTALDAPLVRRCWRWLLCAALAAALLPLALYFGADRGGESLLSYWCQQGMFWFSPIVCAVVRRRGEPRYLRALSRVALACAALTALTTCFWLCEGFTHTPALAYARTLGYANASPELRRSLMLRGVGGYDFIYGCVFSLPLCLYFAHALRGRGRTLALAFLALFTLTAALSQFLYAAIFTAAVYAVWLWGLLARHIARRLFRRELALDWAMLTALIPAALILLLRVPISVLLVRIADETPMSSLRYGARLLYSAVTGESDAFVAAMPSRLDAYLSSLRTFAASPWLGRLTGGAGTIGYHSDALDLLACFGLIGTAAFAAIGGAPGRGLLRGLRRSDARPYVALSLALLALFALLNTIFYSRELSLLLSVGVLLALSCAEGRWPGRPGAARAEQADDGPASDAPQGEATKGNDMQGEAPTGNDAQGEATMGEAPAGRA